MKDNENLNAGREYEKRFVGPSTSKKNLTTLGLYWKWLARERTHDRVPPPLAGVCVCSSCWNFGKDKVLVAAIKYANKFNQ